MKIFDLLEASGFAQYYPNKNIPNWLHAFYKNDSEFEGVIVRLRMNKEISKIDNFSITPANIHISNKSTILSLIDAYNFMAALVNVYPDFFELKNMEVANGFTKEEKEKYANL